MLQIGLLFLLLLSEHVASAPPPIIYHIPFSLRPGEHGGCCGDITALNEHNGIAHLFKESGGKCALPPPKPLRLCQNSPILLDIAFTSP